MAGAARETEDASRERSTPHWRTSGAALLACSVSETHAACSASSCPARAFSLEEIEKRKSALDRRLSSLYARMYRSGASADAKEERRERTHHLCNLGGLVEKAGLGNLEAPVLLGMLLQQAEYLRANPGIENRWKERGIAALNMPER